MLGIVRDASGQAVGCHRTFVDDDGRKAPVHPQRLSLGTLRGAAVRLGGYAPAIIVGEGIETTLAAAMLQGGGAPWACLSAGGLAMLEVPSTVRRVCIAVDHDDAGVAAARRLTKRLGRLGIETRLVQAMTPGHDLSDVLRRVVDR
jgi:hypothetical protein